MRKTACRHRNVKSNVRRDQHVESRPMHTLRPHPRQRELFGQPTVEAIAAMAESMQVSGLLHPIQVTPDDTVVCGHTRLEAAKSLGWKSIPCVILHELASQGSEAIVARMIRDNLDRRQMTKLQRARVTLAMEGLDADKIRRQGLTNDERERVGRVLQMSGRNLVRWLRILATPTPVQDAVDRGELTLGKAGEISYLSVDQQLVIAAAIREGTCPLKAIAQYMNPKKPSSSPNAVLGRFVKSTRQAVAQLSGRTDSLCAYSILQHQSALLQVAQLVQDLLARGSQEEVDRESDLLFAGTDLEMD